MKESKTNQELSGRTGTPDGKLSGSSNQRDPWVMLQSELGLLSSPIGQEQVAVVTAVDPPEIDSQNQETPAEVSKGDVPPVGVPTDSVAGRSTETVAVHLLVPTTSENESDSWDMKSLQEGDDQFGAFDDCGIPKNAFASGKKSKSFRRDAGRNAHFAAAPADMPPQEVPEMQDFALPLEAESAQSETVIDPLLSDELPTSLWQPRKSVPAAKTPAPAAAPSFSDTLSHAAVSKVEGRKKEWSAAGRTAPPDAEQTSADDLGRPSYVPPAQQSAKKRYERGDGRQQEKTFDRRSRESVQDTSYREQLRNTADNPVESTFDDLAWEPKPTAKGRDRKPGKSFRQADIPAFADREDAPKSFGADLDRGNDENDWLDVGIDVEQVSPRPAKQDRRHKSSFDKPDKREKFDKDAKNAYEAERILARRAREEHVREERGESPPRPPAAPKRAETPVKEKTAGTSTQKIAVSSWDDAVRDIIEKNMQRRPVTSGNKNDRDRRNNGGRGHRR